MAAIQQSGLLPQKGKGFNPIMPIYLGVTLPENKALLTTQEALTLSAAFPYAWGRLQEPLSERILTNDLYGIPLYQPSVGFVDPGQKTGAKAAATVIKATGAEPKFLPYRVVCRTESPRMYEVAR